MLATLVGFTIVSCDRPNAEQLQKNLHRPNQDFVADIQQGKILFHSVCASCHGRGGGGSDKGPPLIHMTYRPGHHSDQTFRWAIKGGAKQHHWKFGDMPPQPNVTPEQAGHIIAYVRSEQRKVGVQ